MQPSHALTDRHAADLAWGERCRGAYAWRSLTASGAIVAFGSDAPIEALRPLDAFAAAVHRAAPGGTSWRPEERLSPIEALHALTSGPAYAAGMERRVGRLAPGYHADLTVLDRDPIACPPEEAHTINVVATMVGGRWVHGRPPW